MRHFFLAQTTRKDEEMNNSEQDLHLHIVQDTPAAVRVSGAQTRSTGSVLLAALYRYTGHLSEKHTHGHTVKRKRRSHFNTRT